MKVVVQNLGKRPGRAAEVLRRHEPDVLLAQDITLPSGKDDGGYDLAASKLGGGVTAGAAVAVRRGEGFELTNVRRVASPRREPFGGGGKMLARRKATVITLAAPGTSGGKPSSTSTFALGAEASLAATESCNTSATSTGTGGGGGGGGEVVPLPAEEGGLRIELVSFHGYGSSGGGSPFKSVAGLVEHVAAVLKTLDPNAPAIFAGDFGTRSESHQAAVAETLEWAGFRRALSWPRASKHGAASKSTVMDHAFVRGVRVVDVGVFLSASDRGRTAVLELAVGDEAHHVTAEERQEVRSEHSSRPVTYC